MSYALPATELVAVAAEPQATAVVRTDSVSLFLKPVVRCVKAGFASPYSRLLSCAVTVKCATVTVRCPVTYVKSQLAAASVPKAQLIAYGLPETGLVGAAALEQLAVPVTPDVANVSPFLNAEIVASKPGFTSP